MTDGSHDRDAVEGDVAVVGDVERVADEVAGVGPGRRRGGRDVQGARLVDADRRGRRQRDILGVGVGGRLQRLRARGVDRGGVGPVAGVDVALEERVGRRAGAVDGTRGERPDGAAGDPSDGSVTTTSWSVTLPVLVTVNA